jgi:hypothetical protein
MNNTSFASLKKSGKTQLDKINQELNKLSNPETGGADDRFWRPEVDKSGNGYAVIRFLPAPANEDVPFVRVWDHGFQGPGGWYIEKSLTTLGQKDPVSEYNTELWNSGIESNKEVVRKQKRRLAFVSNIYVVKDPSNPQNEGKVFLYQYGKKIFDKINSAMHPEFQDDESINPFDFWNGANFKLKIRTVEGYRNYDSSAFDTQSALIDDDEELEKIWKQEQSLQEFINQKNFKSYDDLKAKLYRVLNLGGGNTQPRNTAASLLGEEEETPAPAPSKTATPKQPAKAVVADDSDEDDEESLAFFKKLAEED